MTAQDWETLLDEFERALTAQERACRQGTVENFVAFELPDVQTPIPRTLLDRLTGLLWRCSILEDALVAARDALREKIDDLGSKGQLSEAPAEPVYLDSRI